MKKMNRMNWVWSGGRMLLLGLMVMGSALTPVQAAAPCPDFLVDLKFRDADGDAVRSDGRVTYFNLAEMDSCSGGLGVVFFGPFNFKLTVLGPPFNTDGTRSANGNVVFEVGIIDGWQHQNGLLGIEPGKTVFTTKVQFNFVVDSTRHYLAYWEEKYPQPLSFNITVTRGGGASMLADENTWFIEALPAAEARVISQSTKGKSVKTPEPYTQSAPFHLTLTKHF